MLTRIAPFMVLLVILLSTSCTSTIRPARQGLNQLRIGELVTVREYDGSVYRIRITEIGENFIRGDYNGDKWSMSVPENKIQSVDRVNYAGTAIVAISFPFLMISPIFAGYAHADKIPNMFRFP